MKIYTGNYKNCQCEKSVSISKDKGNNAGYFGNYYLKLAPLESFFRIWKNNRGIIDEFQNNIFYMEEYYKQVISKLDIEDVLADISKFGDEIILLCYEDSGEFCHRYLVAAWIEYELGIIVNEVVVLNNGIIKELDSYNIYKTEFINIIKKYKRDKKLIKVK